MAMMFAVLPASMRAPSATVMCEFAIGVRQTAIDERDLRAPGFGVLSSVRSVDALIDAVALAPCS